MIAEYIAAFNRCYPHKTVEIKPIQGKKPNDPLKYSVIIDQQRGDILLSEDDLRYATRLFNAGKGRKVH
jgi:hypothetical protein